MYTISIHKCTSIRIFIVFANLYIHMRDDGEGRMKWVGVKRVFENELIA